ncbi:MAG: hypothetical protein ABL909_06145 [Sphingopyxis sp.]
MMRRFWGNRMVKHIYGLSLAILAMGVPAIAQAPSLTMLAQLEQGQWQLVDRDGMVPSRSICLGDARQLIQLRHEGQQCTRFVVEDSPQSVTVSYSCAGTGNGRTTIRRETNRLVQVETQGVFRGSPFSMVFEARRTGVCH